MPMDYYGDPAMRAQYFRNMGLDEEGNPLGAPMGRADLGGGVGPYGSTPSAAPPVPSAPPVQVGGFGSTPNFNPYGGDPPAAPPVSGGLEPVYAPGWKTSDGREVPWIPRPYQSSNRQNAQVAASTPSSYDSWWRPIENTGNNITGEVNSGLGPQRSNPHERRTNAQIAASTSPSSYGNQIGFGSSTFGNGPRRPPSRPQSGGFGESSRSMGGSSMGGSSYGSQINPWTAQRPGGPPRRPSNNMINPGGNYGEGGFSGGPKTRTMGASQPFGATPRR